jgi:adenylyltransferase/sulfurtransferase
VQRGKPRVNLDFSEVEIQRYSRQILLAEIGGVGQARLRQARVLIVGAGGIGAPLLLYLAGAGIGTLGIVDNDVVELSNLHRQIAHATSRLGEPKTESAAAGAMALNPLVRVVQHRMRLDAANVMQVLDGYDIVCDGTDNAATRYLLADACHLAGKTLVSAAALRFEGQLAIFQPGTACYRCLYPQAAPAGLSPGCADAGVLGAVTGVIGTLAATEVIKLALQTGDTLAGRLLLFDALDCRFRTIALQRDPACALCGESPSIHDLRLHANGA